MRSTRTRQPLCLAHNDLNFPTAQPIYVTEQSELSTLLSKGVRSMAATDISHDAKAVDHAEQNVSVRADAAQEAKDLVARSRYEAFRMITEARSDAEQILTEARSEAAGTRKAAEIAAESKLEAARVRADAMITEAEKRAAAIASEVAERPSVEPPPPTEAALLEAEHDDLSKRVGSLRVLADQLERRFAALAASEPSVATPLPASTNETSPKVPEQIDFAPSVDSKQASPAAVRGASEDDSGTRSIYSRRSAGLPRIGEAAGRDALDMTKSIRRKLEAD